MTFIDKNTRYNAILIFASRIASAFGLPASCDDRVKIRRSWHPFRPSEGFYERCIFRRWKIETSSWTSNVHDHEHRQNNVRNTPIIRQLLSS